MSELRSALEAFCTDNPNEQPDARVEDDFAELQRVVEIAQAQGLRRLAVIERRGLHQRNGHLSAASWLATSFRVGWGSAKEQVRVARALEEMPKTRGALDAG